MNCLKAKKTKKAQAMKAQNEKAKAMKAQKSHADVPVEALSLQESAAEQFRQKVSKDQNS